MNSHTPKPDNILDFFTRGRNPRKVQVDALEFICETFRDKQFAVLEGPTGCAKSEIGMAMARAHGNAFITSPLKILVDQYERDFPELKAVKGKTNYRCSAFPFPAYIPLEDRTCATASDLDDELHARICRDYIPIRNTYWRGPLSVTTLAFSFWALMPFQLSRGLEDRSLLIIDECHGLENALCDFGKVQITARQVQKLGMSVASYNSIASADHATAERFATEFKERAIAASKDNNFSKKEQRTFLSKARSLAMTLEIGDWLHYRKTDEETGREQALILKPMCAHVPAAQLFAKADKILFMSATVGKAEQFLAELGVPESHAAWHYAPSEFPLANRKIHFFPFAYLSANNEDTALPRIIDGCRQVLDQRPDKKGLILCSSYPLQGKLAAQLGPRILTHTAENKEEVIARHKAGPAPTVLLGVFLHEGLDLPDDQARFLILPKVLYPYLGDPYIKERMNRDKRWYYRQTIVAMVQAAGRVVRTPTDWAEIVILDSCFGLLLEHPEMFPGWFLEAVIVNGKKRPQKVTALPAAEKEGC